MFDLKLSAQRVRKEELEQMEAHIKEDLRNFDSFLKVKISLWAKCQFQGLMFVFSTKSNCEIRPILGSDRWIG